MEEKKEESSVRDIIKFVLIVGIIVIPFRLFVAQPYIVEGSSMEPTFSSGDYLIVDQISTHFSDPIRGEVIIMKYPKDPSKYFIKRIIGLPGETVTIKNGKVSISGGLLRDTIELEENYVIHEKSEDLSENLGGGDYFVMGDNRAGSSDSRIWGPLPESHIVGRPILRLLPLDQISVFPGK